MKKFLLFAVLVLGSIAVQAQREAIFTVQNYLEQGELDKAKLCIDSAINTTLKMDPGAWYVRGFAYKEYYRKYETRTRALANREEAFRSFKRSKQLDATDEFLKDNQQNIKALSIYYYNDVKAFVDSLKYIQAIQYYALYKRTAQEADSLINFTKKDIEVNLALGSVYLRLADRNPAQRAEFIEKEKAAFNKVLEIDPNNITANYNMALLFYNQAVKIINNMGYDEDIIRLINITDTCGLLFKEALPFMEKADQLNPNRLETLTGLSGIYFSLNEEEKKKAVEERLRLLQQNNSQEIDSLNKQKKAIEERLQLLQQNNSPNDSNTQDNKVEIDSLNKQKKAIEDRLRLLQQKNSPNNSNPQDNN